MGQVSLTGNLIAGPVSGENVFPRVQADAPLLLSQEPKGFGEATGLLARTLTSASTFVALPTPPRVELLYIHAGDNDFQLRLTQDDGAGGQTQQVTQHHGLYVSEFPVTKAAILVEVAAATVIEYFASGPTPTS